MIQIGVAVPPVQWQTDGATFCCVGCEFQAAVLAWIKRLAAPMDIEKQNVLILPDKLISAVAQMHVKVDDHDALDVVSALQVARGRGDVVDETEPTALTRAGVVARWPHKGKPTPHLGLGVHDDVHESEDAAHPRLDRLSAALTHIRVGVHRKRKPEFVACEHGISVHLLVCGLGDFPRGGLLGQPQYLVHVRLAVGQHQLVTCGRPAAQHRQLVKQTLILQVFNCRSEPLRPLRVHRWADMGAEQLLNALVPHEHHDVPPTITEIEAGRRWHI
mmetsp:Transcript_40143/g.114434  ORF Transcript_40143/g.114434 Transcript_40143/m.114434 type:complete len:274 (+) Transcript_40143:1789-2610(+)